MSLFLSELFLATAPHIIWMHQRSCRWWEDVVLQSFQDRDWIENFWVRRSIFLYLCNQLIMKPANEKQNTTMRQRVSLEHKVAITLWVLTTTYEYRTVGHLFGVARNTSAWLSMRLVSLSWRHFFQYTYNFHQEMNWGMLWMASSKSWVWPNESHVPYHHQPWTTQVIIIGRVGTQCWYRQ